ncbi:NWD1 protein, partial [Lindgomyces ingoldianus]
TLIKLVQDKCRFIMHHKRAIESSPLRAYRSALLFSPEHSLIRQFFKQEELTWATIKPAMSDGWSACLQTLEIHSDWVNPAAFSHDSAQLASLSGDRTVKVWDVSSDDGLQTLKGHSDSALSVAFFHDSARLASAPSD